MNYNAIIQNLSDIRDKLNEEAANGSFSNPEQAEPLWAAADAVVRAMWLVEDAEPEHKTVAFGLDELMAEINKPAGDPL